MMYPITSNPASTLKRSEYLPLLSKNKAYNIVPVIAHHTSNQSPKKGPMAPGFRFSMVNVFLVSKLIVLVFNSVEPPDTAS